MRLVCLAVVLLAFATVSCGDDGGDSSLPPETAPTDTTNDASEAAASSLDPDVPPFEVAPDGRSFGIVAMDPEKTAEELLAVSPDFVAVLNRDGTEVPGYVHKSEMFSFERSIKLLVSGDEIPLEVFMRDGNTVVGHWWNGIGFVGLDEDRSEIDDPTRETTE